jgi:general L-amino acid transport system substrate-binding protein
MRKMIPIVLGFAAALAVGASAEGQTLKTVQDRGSLICGVNPGLEGFASKDADGKWSGFDVDFCRAVAAAIFDDPSKVQPTWLPEGFGARVARPVDLLRRVASKCRGEELRRQGRGCLPATI